MYLLSVHDDLGGSNANLVLWHIDKVLSFSELSTEFLPLLPFVLSTRHSSPSPGAADLCSERHRKRFTFKINAQPWHLQYIKSRYIDKANFSKWPRTKSASKPQKLTWPPSKSRYNFIEQTANFFLLASFSMPESPSLPSPSSSTSESLVPASAPEQTFGSEPALI